MSNDHSHTAYRRPHRSLKSKYKLSEAPISIQNETKSELVVTRKSTAKHFLVWAVILLMLLLLSSQQHEYKYNDDARNVSDGDVIVKKVPEESENDANGESCLRPRRNSNAAVKSPLKPPCEFINFFIFSLTCQVLSNKRTHIFVLSSRFYFYYASYQFGHAQNGFIISSQLL